MQTATLISDQCGHFETKSSAKIKVIYNAPNRAHHYAYALELHRAGILGSFVSGFPRYSPRSPFPEIGQALKRADEIQTLFIASQKLRLPHWFCDALACRAQIYIDQQSRGPLNDADVFIFYNGCGLNSARWFKQKGGIGIVEAVNSHVLVQEQILAEEHKMLGLAWRPFHPPTVKRRVAEVDEADFILLPSSFVARSFMARGVPAHRLIQIPFPMQKITGADSPPRKTEPDDSIFRVLYVGSISLRKGLRYLIEAFRQFKHPKKELWIVGPSASPTGLEDLTLPDEVKFLGPLKGDALQQAYARATVFCLPSIEEGLALVLTEALYYGVPVIATENTGIEDLFPDETGGMVVPIRDPQAICGWLTRLAEDQELLARKINAAAGAKDFLQDHSKSLDGLAATLLKKFRSAGSKGKNEVN